MALVDALGTVARFVLLPGQRHDSIGVEPLIEDIDFAALIADKAFDHDSLRATLNERGALAVIPSTAHRKTPIPHDTEMYKWRHLIENCFQRRKVSARRHPVRQNRHEFRRGHPLRRHLHRAPMNVYRP